MLVRAARPARGENFPSFFRINHALEVSSLAARTKQEPSRACTRGGRVARPRAGNARAPREASRTPPASITPRAIIAAAVLLSAIDGRHGVGHGRARRSNANGHIPIKTRGRRAPFRTARESWRKLAQGRRSETRRSGVEKVPVHFKSLFSFVPSHKPCRAGWCAGPRRARARARTRARRSRAALPRRTRGRALLSRADPNRVGGCLGRNAQRRVRRASGATPATRFERTTRSPPRSAFRPPSARGTS